MNLIERLLHEQYHSADGEPVLFCCTECKYRSQSLGALHGHVEGHRGYTRFNIQIPFTETSPANTEQLMKYTEIRKVTDTEEITLSEVDDL